MPKTLKNIFPEVVSFENLRVAARKAQKGKRYRQSTLEFNFRLEENLVILRRELVEGTYHPGPYHDFVIHETKPRMISAAPYRDRVVHHALMNILEPHLDPKFIDHTYACRKGKGTHAALRHFRSWLRKYPFVLKCDIRKYFPSIDHEILRAKILRRISDKGVLWLVDLILASKTFNEMTPPAYFPGDELWTPWERPRGLPVGNLTSQFFANLYLDDFDHWVTETWPGTRYLRYVDDFCLFARDKGYLAAARVEFETKLATLRLRLNAGKSRTYRPKEGVEFLGFVHLPHQTRLRSQNIRQFRRRMRALEREYAEGRISLGRVGASVRSWCAHAAHADTWRLRNLELPVYVFVRGKRSFQAGQTRRQLEQQCQERSRL